MNKYLLIVFFPLLIATFIASFFVFNKEESYEEPIEIIVIETKQLKEPPSEINAIYLTGP